MSIESETDWRGLREIGRIVRLTLEAMEEAVRPGVTTGELDAVARRVFVRNGARSAPAMVYGFPATVLISVNDEVVHGIPGPRRLESGDIVKLDVTAEKQGYVADAARTVVVGDEPELAARLKRCSEDAFGAALRVARAGRKVNEIGREVDRVVSSRGFTVIRSLSGHGVGRTIHEAPSVPNYFDPRQRDRLTMGLVLTIEPLISSGNGEVYEDGDGWTIRTKDGSLAAHYEHTMVITDGEPILLTAA
jgi:methionyl aminopeptidase